MTDIADIRAHPGYIALKELSTLKRAGKHELPTLISSSAQTLLERYNNTTTLGWAGSVASTTLKNSFTYIGIPFSVLFVAKNISSVIDGKEASNAGLVLSALATSFFVVPYIFRNAKYQAEQEYNTGIGFYLNATAQQQTHVRELSQKIKEFGSKALKSCNVGQNIEFHKTLQAAQQNLEEYKKTLRMHGFRSNDVDEIVSPLKQTLPSLFNLNKI